MKTWQLVLVVVVALFGGGYFSRDALVRTLDAHYYEPTLRVCVKAMGWIAPDRLDIELQAFCNVTMVTVASRAHGEEAQSSD